MSFIDSTTATIIATLTRRGKELLATDSSKFNIVKFAFDDSEINYVDFDGSTPDASNAVILQTPILQSTTNSLIGLRWGVVTLPNNTTSVAQISSSINKINASIGDNVNITIRTLYGNDSGYYVSTNSKNILLEKDFYESTSNDDNFDVFQNETMCSINFKILNSQQIKDDKTISVVVKGKDTGATTRILVFIIESIAANNSLSATNVDGLLKGTDQEEARSIRRSQITTFLPGTKINTGA
jgi:hypothetical protein